MKRTMLLAAALCLLLTATAWAQSAEQILKKMDDQATAFKDLKGKMTLTVKSGDGPDKKIELVTYQKGSKRLYHFLESGMALLSFDADTSYVYMPDEKKIRRIAAHSQNQTFMGTDYNASDMSITRYDEVYAPKLVETTDAAYVLELTPKAGKTPAYGKIRIWIDKVQNYVVKLDYYNKKGEAEKVETRQNFQKINGQWMCLQLEISSSKANHKTLIKFNDVQVDSGLDDELFTQRQLKRLEQ